MKFNAFVVGVIFSLLVSYNAEAQGFISVAEMVESNKKMDYVVLDARSKSSYNTSHIKGAISIPVRTLTDTVPFDGSLGSPEVIAERLGMQGIESDMNIVVYCNSGNAGGRLYWILRYLGAENVYMLDGNIGAWEKRGEPMSGKATKKKRKKTFKTNIKPEMIATLEEVEKAVADNSALLIDIRSAEYYNGLDEDSEGHIKGAVSLPSENLKEDNGLLKTTGELIALTDSLGITPGKPVILYGQSAMTTGFVYNVLTSLLEFRDVKIYDGSYNEWASLHRDELEK